MTPNPQYNYRFRKLTLHFIEKSSQALLEVSPALYCSFKLFTKILKGSFYIWCKLSDPINQFCFNVLIYIRLLWSCDSSFPHLSRLLCGTKDLESGNKVTNTKSKSSSKNYLRLHEKRTKFPNSKIPAKLENRRFIKTRIELLFALVPRIAANRCFHGTPVFDGFHGDASAIREGFCWVEPLGSLRSETRRL